MGLNEGNADGNGNEVVFHYRKIDEPILQGLVVDGDLTREVFRGRESHPYRIHLVLYCRNLYSVADGDTSVCPGEVVDPHLSLVPIRDY